MERDKAVINAQNILCKWLAEQEQCAATWNTISSVCAHIIQPLSKEVYDYFGDYPAYKILIPLLRNGTIEVCRKQDRKALYYCLNPHPYESPQHSSIAGKIFSAMEFLHRYPSIEIQIRQFPVSSIADSSLQSIMKISISPDERKSYEYDSYNTTANTEPIIGIYKIHGLAWETAYLYEKQGTIRKIPSYSDNP